MINYCVDYYEIHENGYVDEGTLIFDSRVERQEYMSNTTSTISDVYENEDCYCHAHSWGECGCGNFKE